MTPLGHNRMAGLKQNADSQDIQSVSPSVAHQSKAHKANEREHVKPVALDQALDQVMTDSNSKPPAGGGRGGGRGRGAAQGSHR